jgi:hypothetical protein
MMDNLNLNIAFWDQHRGHGEVRGQDFVDDDADRSGPM